MELSLLDFAALCVFYRMYNYFYSKEPFDIMSTTTFRNDFAIDVSLERERARGASYIRWTLRLCAIGCIDT